MPSIVVTAPISEYGEGYTVTVHLDTAMILSDFGDQYDHIELQDDFENTFQTSADTSVVVSDTNCIFFDESRGGWLVGYALFVLVEGEPSRVYYSGYPNAITTASVPPIPSSEVMIWTRKFEFETGD